jgi:hypothetical protein
VLSKQGAHACWQLGDVGRARELIEKAFTRALKSEHAPTLVNTYNFKVTFETLVSAMPKPPYAPPHRSSNSAWNTSFRSIW